jgi:hypothetical protein
MLQSMKTEEVTNPDLQRVVRVCVRVFVCEAHGGQVLLTHDAWVKLRNDMARAGFPVIHQLGFFKLPVGKEMWLYNVVEAVGKPLNRTFPPPRKVELVRCTDGTHQAYLIMMLDATG